MTVAQEAPVRVRSLPIFFEPGVALLLKFGPTFLNPYAGYLCIVSDPDGHRVEFSHGQALGMAAERSDSQQTTKQMIGRV